MIICLEFGLQSSIHNFEDPKWEKAFNEYKLEMKKGIERIHSNLQNMSCLDYNFDFDPVPAYPLEELDDYGYEKEKSCIFSLRSLWNAQTKTILKHLFPNKTILTRNECKPY